MTERYKVWVHVERISGEEGEEEYEDVGLPDTIGRFLSQKEAFAFVRTLPGWSNVAETSDYRDVGQMCRCGSGEKEHYSIGVPLGDIQLVCPGQLEDIDTFTPVGEEGA